MEILAKTHLGTYDWILRIMLSAVFIFSGTTKLLNFSGTAAEMAHFSLPFPELVAIGVIALQLLCGAAIVIGRWVTPSAIALATFTFFATVMAHTPINSAFQSNVREWTVALEHLAIIGGLLLLARLHWRKDRAG